MSHISKTPTKTTSKCKGDIDVFNSKHYLEYEKNFIWARLVFVQEREQ